MAKPIKFNLICDNHPVRTIEDLQNNFVVEDVVDYYQNGLLQRWLKVRGYMEQLERVTSISSDKLIDVVAELINIFQISSDKKEVEKSLHMLGYLEERQALYDTYIQGDRELQVLIDNYRWRYNRLVDGILDNPGDAALIKANLAEIAENYEWILELNHRELFYRLKEYSILAVMCLLMNEKTRWYYLPKKIARESTDVYETIDDMGPDKAAMYQEICKIIRTLNLQEQLGENCCVFSGATEGYWKDLEPKGQKYMIISMGQGNFVRSSGERDGDLGNHDITCRFLILDGIDYKSNSNTDKLIYMEV